MRLASYRIANRDFFEAKRGPRKEKWREWIERGIVAGKVIGEDVFVDLNEFAANDVMATQEPKPLGIDLLA